MKSVFIHEDNKFSSGTVALVMQNNGWVGTNNGWPHIGQPALFPEDQAQALLFVWNFAKFLGAEKILELVPNPEGIKDEEWFKKWIEDKT